ncbi:MAG: glycosyltransferase [Kineothrix sp.]|nr:glycosyltransferase [Kineothrix sp.]
MVIRMDRLVSIVVPVFNAGKYIDETVETVRNQSYGNWELLLVDDCSKDDSREKIQEWCRKDP